MGSVAQAVVEFDEAVQAPWRPPLAGAAGRGGRLRVVTDQGSAHGGAGRVHDRPSTPRPRRPSVPVHRSVPRRVVPCDTTAAPAPPALRLTRRARRLGVVLGLAVGVVVGSWVGSAVAGGEDGLRLAGEGNVVVRQGDTLWSIAAAVAGEEDDVRAVIAEIRELNGLADASLVPGQLLALP